MSIEFFNFLNNESLEDLEIIPTTGGEHLFRYMIKEGDDIIEVTQGIHGAVFDFADGTSTVHQEDGDAITLRPDNTITLVYDGVIEDVPSNDFGEMFGCFEHAVQQALRGD